MSKLLAVLVAIFAAAWFAVPAFAQGPGGYIEICKATTGTLTGPFTFQVNDAAQFDVQAGTCSEPLWVETEAQAEAVPAQFTVSVTEVGHPWFMISGFDYRDWNGVTHTMAAADLPEYAGEAEYVFDEIPVLVSDDPRDATVVHVTDDPVTGTIEICKYAEDTSGASGTFSFGITSPANGWRTNLPAMPDVSVTIGDGHDCHTPIAVPAGTTIVNEVKSNGQLYVTDIAVTPGHHMIGDPDLGEGTVTVRVPAAIDEDGETMVAFTNSTATLKVCKEVVGGSLWKAAAADLGPYWFSATGAAAKFSLQPLAPSYIVCHEVGKFAAGAPVTVTEDAVPGTAVKSIELMNGTGFDDGDTIDLAARTVTFFIRPGLDEVVFSNALARSDPLKVCKLGTGVTGTFSFSVSGATGYTEPFWGLDPGEDGVAVPASFTVRAGQCTDVGYFPYNSTITITETAGTLLDVAIDPTSISAVLLSKDLGARHGVVYLGNYEKAWSDAHDFFPAIVNFTNGPGAAPAPAVTPAAATPVTTAAPQGVATVASTSTPTKVVVPKASLKVSTARIVSVGKLRYVVVRVNGAAKTARIHVTLINKQHKVVGNLTRYVSTNKAVRVGNLRLAPSVHSVKVSL